MEGAVQALQHGLTAVEGVAVGMKARQRQRHRHQIAPHPASPIEVGQTVGALIHNAAAALAAILLQCAAAEAVALAQCGAVQHPAPNQPPNDLSQSDNSRQQDRGQPRASRPSTQPARGRAGGSGRRGMATVKQLTDWGVLHILTATIKGAYARRGWSSDALLPVVSALLAVGTYISEASVAGRPDCHGIAAVPMHGPPSRPASSDAASAGGTARAAAAQQPAAWIEAAATAAAEGCAALVKATVKLHQYALRTGGPRAGVASQADTVHDLGMVAAGCLTLADLVSGPSTSGALRAEAGPAIYEGLLLVSMTPDCTEIAGMLVPCCRALAITFSLAPRPDGGGSGSGTGFRGDDERTAALGAERSKRDASVLEAASKLAAAVRTRWSNFCQQLSSR